MAAHIPLELGAFSVSLAVKSLSTSRRFYEVLGFSVTGGSEEQNYLIMSNGSCLIGLFEGMFESNILTFNPGLTHSKERLDSFTDVREIQRHLKENGLPLIREADETTTGAGSVVLEDPDGNAILIDQFF